MRTRSPAVARDAYLAWQAELGGEEVVLTAPWVRRAPATPGNTGGASPGRGAPTRSGAAPTAPSLPEVHFEPMKPFVVPGLTGSAGTAPFDVRHRAGPEFFSEIAERLAESGRTGASRPQNPSPAPPSASASSRRSATPVMSPLQEALAGLKDPEAYWNFLAVEYPRWFAGTQGMIRAHGHAAPRLAVVELAPTGDGLFTGDAGVLFDRMMSAIGLSREQMYLTSLMKSPPPYDEKTVEKTGVKAWARKDTARMVPVLLRELQLAQCGLVLVMGEACAQAVLKTGRSIPDLVKTPLETAGVSLSATWHPAEIRAADARAAQSGDGTGTKNGADGGKAPRPRATQAWDHLQWLRGLLPR